MNKKETIRTNEYNLFEYEDWEQGQFMELMFYDSILLKDIGKFKRGTKIGLISINHEMKTITLFTGDEHEISNKFKLNLEAGEKIK